MPHEHSAPLKELSDKIPTGYSSHGVPEDTIETELLSHHIAINIKGITGKSATTKWTNVSMLVRPERTYCHAQRYLPLVDTFQGLPQTL